jgi:hypothetical protein
MSKGRARQPSIVYLATARTVLCPPNSSSVLWEVGQRNLIIRIIDEKVCNIVCPSFLKLKENTEKLVEVMTKLLLLNKGLDVFNSLEK